MKIALSTLCWLISFSFTIAQNRILSSAPVCLGNHSLVYVLGNTTIDNPAIITQHNSSLLVLMNDVLTTSHDTLLLNGTVSFSGNTPQQNQTVLKASSIIVNNASGISFTQDALAADTLSMKNGDITLGTSKCLALGNSVTIPGNLQYTAGRVYGMMKRWFAKSVNSGVTSSLFPLGYNGGDRFVTIEYTTEPLCGGALTIQFDPSRNSRAAVSKVISAAGTCSGFYIDSVAKNGFWECDTTYLSGGTYDITLVYEDYPNLSDLCGLTAIKNPSGSGIWIESGIHHQSSGTTLRPSVKRTGAGSFSKWAFSDGVVNPLPVTWLNFTVTQQNVTAFLQWATSSELNCDYYDIERSKDANSWIKIGSEKGGGNSSEILNYSLTDFHPETGINYYRIKQVDFDGSYEYSQIKWLRFNSDDNGIAVYPNPTSGMLTIDYIPVNAGSVTIRNYLGEVVMERATAGGTEQMDISALAKGIYLLQAGTVALKIVKQ